MPVKVYDDQLLQQNLLSLAARISGVSGIDQGTLIGHIGGVQGASSTQHLLSLQASMVPLPSIATTTGSSTPASVQTTGSNSSGGTSPQVVTTQSTSSGTAATVPTAATSVVTTTSAGTSGTTSQTVTTIPSSTQQIVTTQPSVTPAPAPLPTGGTPAMPSNYGVSSLNALSEETQLSYQLINLQTLLQGALNDDYTTDGRAKRHVTLGFPISLDPAGHLGDAAEVEVSVCPDYTLKENEEPPSLRTIIPQEKTYNVAKIVNDTTQLGAGAVISNVINIGASYQSGHQTYYLVQEQDTIAQQRKASQATPPVVCPNGVKPVVFAWQFRPVLGQPAVEQNPISTLAQISIDQRMNAGETEKHPNQSVASAYKSTTLTVTINSCWRKYDQNSGIVGARMDCNREAEQTVSPFLDTINVAYVKQTDNEDGTVTVRVHGSYEPGTRVALGNTYLNESVAGFEHNGTFIRFSAPNQLLALYGARLISNDGRDVSIQEPDDLLPKCFEPPPGASPSASFVPYSDTQVLVTVPFTECLNGTFCNQRTEQDKSAEDDKSAQEKQKRCEMSAKNDGPFPLVAILNGKAFGMSDAPFRSKGPIGPVDLIDSTDPKTLTFVAPSTLVQGQTTLTLRRLLLDQNKYDVPYALVQQSPNPHPQKTTDPVSVSNLIQIGTSKAGPMFAMTGSNLQNATIQYPTSGITPTVSQSSTLWEFTLASSQVKTTKQIILTSASGAWIAPVALPAVTGSDDSSTANAPKITLLGPSSVPDKTSFVLTGPQGLDKAKFVYPSELASKTWPATDTSIQFDLTTATLKDVKVIGIELPAPKNAASAPSGKAGAQTAAAKPATPPAASGSGNTTPTTYGPPSYVPLSSADGSAAGTKAVLTPAATPIAKGATTPYKIMGSNLNLVLEIRYLNVPLAFTCSTDGTSISVPLPAGAVANSGDVPLDVRMSDGSRQLYTVIVQ